MLIESTVNTNVCTAQAYRELGFLAELILEAQNLLRAIHATKLHEYQVTMKLGFCDQVYPPLGIRMTIHAPESTIDQFKVALKDRQTLFDFGTITLVYNPCSPSMFTLD